MTVQFFNVTRSIIEQIINHSDKLDSLRKLYFKPKMSQRDLAKSLGFSLGKLNYCLKSLKQKGLIKITNFQNQGSQLRHIKYILTRKGISLRYRLTINFMKKK